MLDFQIRDFQPVVVQVVAVVKVAIVIMLARVADVAAETLCFNLLGRSILNVLYGLIFTLETHCPHSAGKKLRYRGVTCLRIQG
jgi:hypothetical protein